MSGEAAAVDTTTAPPPETNEAGAGNEAGQTDPAAVMKEAQAFQLKMFALNMENASFNAQISTQQSIANRVAQT